MDKVSMPEPKYYMQRVANSETKVLVMNEHLEFLDNWGMVTEEEVLEWFTPISSWYTDIGGFEMREMKSKSRRRTSKGDSDGQED